MQEEALDKFLDEMLTEKKLPGLTDQIKPQLIAEMKEQLLNQINRELIAAMPDKKMDEFNSLLDQSDKTEEDIQQFITNSGVNTKAVTARTILRFRDLYLQTEEERKG